MTKLVVPVPLNDMVEAIKRAEPLLPLGLTDYGYCDLALACLDQAGLRPHMLALIVDVIRQHNEEYPHVAP